MNEKESVELFNNMLKQQASMSKTNRELTKLFLNIEKQIIDFRLNLLNKQEEEDEFSMKILNTLASPSELSSTSTLDKLYQNGYRYYNGATQLSDISPEQTKELLKTKFPNYPLEDLPSEVTTPTNTNADYVYTPHCHTSMNISESQQTSATNNTHCHTSMNISESQQTSATTDTDSTTCNCNNKKSSKTRKHTTSKFGDFTPLVLQKLEA